MDWEKILQNSIPFIAMLFLIALIVMATCVRKLEEYEERRLNPILFDFTDFPEIPSLDDIKTPITYENNFFKENIARVFQPKLRHLGALIEPPTSKVVPDASTITDDGRYNSETDGVSFDYEVYKPDTVEYKESP